MAHLECRDLKLFALTKIGEEGIAKSAPNNLVEQQTPDKALEDGTIAKAMSFVLEVPTKELAGFADAEGLPSPPGDGAVLVVPSSRPGAVVRALGMTTETDCADPRAFVFDTAVLAKKPSYREHSAAMLVAGARGGNWHIWCAEVCREL